MSLHQLSSGNKLSAAGDRLGLLVYVGPGKVNIGESQGVQFTVGFILTAQRALDVAALTRSEMETAPRLTLATGRGRLLLHPTINRH